MWTCQPNSTSWLILKLQFVEKANKVKESSLLEVVFEKQTGSNALYAFPEFWKIVISVIKWFSIHCRPQMSFSKLLRSSSGIIPDDRARNCQSGTDLRHDNYWSCDNIDKISMHIGTYLHHPQSNKSRYFKNLPTASETRWVLHPTHPRSDALALDLCSDEL